MEILNGKMGFELPKPVGVLQINESLCFMVYEKLPNHFRRWMVKLLLGWEYRECKEDATWNRMEESAE